MFKENIFSAAPKYRISKSDVEKEIGRLDEGSKASIDELKNIYKKLPKSISVTEAEIFNAHALILEDVSFIESIKKHIDNDLINAESAVIETIKEYEKKLNALPSDYLKERVQDINDIGKRILHNLGIKHSGFGCSYAKENAIIVGTQEITPFLIAELEHKNVKGIVAEEGSPTSHGSILARALGIPVIIGVSGLMANVNCGDYLAVNAAQGVVNINPSVQDLNGYKKEIEEAEEFSKKILLKKSKYAFTKDEEKVYLSANAGTLRDVLNAKKYGIEDVGLYRTEFMFLSAEEEPEFGKQVELYKKVINAIKGTVTFRLLDVGGDKFLNYIKLPKQDNPYLGLRGVRLYNEYSKIINNQIKAVLTAKGNKNLNLMIPMVSTLEEFLNAKKNIYKVIKSMGKGEKKTLETLKIGAMIEVPSAVFMIEEIINEADFLSIGSNDLIQYLMGVDRNNVHLADLSNPFQPAVIKILEHIIKSVKDSGKDVLVCGEIASDPGMVGILIGLGYRHLSVNPLSINKVRDQISKYNLEEYREMANYVLNTKTLAGVEKIITKLR